MCRKRAHPLFGYYSRYEFFILASEATKKRPERLLMHNHLSFGNLKESAWKAKEPIFTSRNLQEKKQGIMTTITSSHSTSAHEKAPAQNCRGLQYLLIKALMPFLSSHRVSRVHNFFIVAIFKMLCDFREFFIRSIVNLDRPTVKPVHCKYSQ